MEGGRRGGGVVTAAGHREKVGGGRWDDITIRIVDGDGEAAGGCSDVGNG